MGFFLLLEIFAFLVSSFNLRIRLAPISNTLQKMCSDAVAISAHQDLQKALVCGVDLPLASHWKNILIHSGLIHLVVVSGSHFVILLLALEFLCTKLRIQKFHKILIWIGLPLYALISGIQSPAVRSLLAIFLGEFSSCFRLGWSRLNILFASVVLSFSFYPAWTSSLSLVLSASATMALVAWPKAKDYQRQAIIFILLLPALAGLQTFHPLHIITNLIFAPALSFLLLPLAVLATVLPSSLIMFTAFAELTKKVLEWVVPLSPLPQHTNNLSMINWLWGFWIVSWLFLTFHEIKTKRENWHF